MIKPKPEIMNTPSAYHGAFDYDELAQLGLSDEDVIDFSVNSNPYGPPTQVHEAISKVALDRYPDKECLALRHKLAQRHNCKIENIVVGNGTAELLMLIAMAFIQPNDDVLIVEPTFGEYERVSKLAGARVHKVKTTIDDSFDMTVDNYMAVMKDKKVIFECNPNNPTGLIHPKYMVDKYLTAYPDMLYVMDCAYYNFVDPRYSYHGADAAIPKLADNLLTVFSLTKDYAIAGLRLGYVIGHPDLIEAIRRMRPAWNVNSLAQVAGLAVLESGVWLADTVKQLHQDKAHLISGLQDLGYDEPLSSTVHYFLLNVGDAKQFRSQLLQHKIMVRDCTSFGLPEYVRISTRTPEDNAKLLTAIAEIQDGR
jgi:histidinol-phosphate aminotransferase